MDLSTQLSEALFESFCPKCKSKHFQKMKCVSCDYEADFDASDPPEDQVAPDEPPAKDDDDEEEEEGEEEEGDDEEGDEETDDEALDKELAALEDVLSESLSEAIEPLSASGERFLADLLKKVGSGASLKYVITEKSRNSFMELNWIKARITAPHAGEILVGLAERPQKPSEEVIIKVGFDGVPATRVLESSADGLRSATRKAISRIKALVKGQDEKSQVTKPSVRREPKPASLDQRLRHFLRGMRIGPAGRVTRVDREGPSWMVDTSGRQRDPDDDYEGTVSRLLQKRLDKEFGRGTLDVEIGDKGWIDIQAIRR